ncbi:rhomboid family intramembrane serine protease [Carnimonas bestiolae]|uniref:rhomboid family intramembrane serine protease n=1 Tax=Carnimonas bestiolae TaxID=3402172 RepID=UPI003EDC52F4
MQTPVLRFAPDVDLAPLRQALWQSRITHDYRASREWQVIALADPDRYQETIALIERWQAGEPLRVERPPRAIAESSPWRRAVQAALVTSLLIAACLVVYGVLQLPSNRVFQALSIVPLNSAGEPQATLSQTLGSGAWWRLVTPALMHFSLMHLLNNLLWVWVFGRQLELRAGRFHLLMFSIVVALISNLAQYVANGPLFGGMSGVVFGYVGYLWLLNWLRPAWQFFVPTPLVVFMLGWLAFGFTSLPALLGLGTMANGAHVAGLCAGIFAALVTHFTLRIAPLDGSGSQSRSSDE